MTKEEMLLLRDLMREEIGTALQPVEKRLDQMQGDISAMQKDFVEMKGEIGQLKDDVAGIKGEIVEMKGEIVQLKDDVAGIKGEIAEMKGEIGQLKDDVAEMKEDIDQIKEDAEITRVAVNALGEWAENVAVVTAITYPVKKAR